MGRRLVVDWQEDENTLKQKYQAEKDAQKRTRLHALWLLRQGNTIATVGKIVGIHSRTVQDWIVWYREGGVANVLVHRQGGQGSKKSWLSNEQKEKLKEVASQGEISCIQEGIDWVKKEYGISYKYDGMRTLFHRLKLKKKVTRPYNPKASPQEQESWKKRGLLTS